MRQPLLPEKKLAVTLRFLTTGKSYSSMYQYRITTASISKFVPEVCEAIYDALLDEYMKFPQTADDWLKISQGYEERW